ncbi:MAG: metallophosphoesterase [Micromonosporaceae bacterium]|nr:metallophosphoesterase [Micromonosporaceae bacterium]
MWRLPRTRPARTAGSMLLVVLVALTGAIAGLLLNGRVEHPVGPFRAEFSISPSLTGQTEVVIPPLGSLILDSHDAPATLTVRLQELDPKRARRLVSDPDAISRASQSAVDDVESGLLKLAATGVGSALLGALILSALVYRRDARRIAGAGVVAIGLVAGTAGLAYTTVNLKSIEEPRYEGLLVNVPAVVGDARRIADRYEEYQALLQHLVTNVGKLYTTVADLQVYEPDENSIRVLHVADLHLNPSAFRVISSVAEQFNVDVIVDAGDFTDWGSEREGVLYADGIGKLEQPYVYVRGNHDSEETAKAIAAQKNAIVLDNNVGTVAGLTFAGIGDPRFTPDKRRNDAYTNAGLRLHTNQLVETIQAQRKPVDVGVMHDPVAADVLDGVVPVVLAGHTHKRKVKRLDGGSLMMVQGSTGGAGLRGLEQDEPQPLELSVLYFDRETRALQAYDDIAVGGAGRTEVTLERHVLDRVEEATTPAGKPSPTRSPGS